MRRRVAAPPPELSSLHEWRRVFKVGDDADSMWSVFCEWRAARERFAAQHNWPGGEVARMSEEDAVSPGAPWRDPLPHAGMWSRQSSPAGDERLVCALHGRAVDEHL